MSGGTGIKSLEKLDSVLQAYPGIQKVDRICTMLTGDESPRLFAVKGKFDLSLEVLPSGILIKYAPTTSCDVERSFSRCTTILPDQSDRSVFIISGAM